MTLPDFPVDDATLDLLSAALDPGEDSERSSVGDFLEFMSQMGGSDTTAVDEVTWGDPLGMGESVEIHMMRDAAYHEHDVIRALVKEIRRLSALLHAKESWIDGAKVDLDGYAEARAAFARVFALCVNRDAEHAEFLRRVEKGEVIMLDRATGPVQVRVDDVYAALRGGS